MRVRSRPMPRSSRESRGRPDLHHRAGRRAAVSGVRQAATTVSKATGGISFVIHGLARSGRFLKRWRKISITDICWCSNPRHQTSQRGVESISISTDRAATGSAPAKAIIHNSLSVAGGDSGPACNTARRIRSSPELTTIAGWFVEQGAQRICVNVDPKSIRTKVLLQVCAQPLNEHWMIWDDARAIRPEQGN